ncbi:MAG TPA: septum formation initiator family protein [bacterium]|nr:septum formation initiator family protein [bacterium]
MNNGIPITALVKARRKRRWIVLALLGFAVFCFLKVWQSVRVDQLNRRNAELSRELRKIADENALLEACIEHLKNQDRIVAIARDKLGLVQAPKINISVAPD